MAASTNGSSLLKINRISWLESRTSASFHGSRHALETARRRLLGTMRPSRLLLGKAFATRISSSVLIVL
jgi:hypothetical protein